MSEYLASQIVEQPPVGSTPALERDRIMRSAQQVLYLGIDGGGTKTHAVVTTADFRVIGEGISGPSNPVRVGFEQAADHVDEAVREACAAAGVRLQDVAHVCVAIAGISHPIHYHTMKETLERTLGMGNIHLVTDAQAALTGALDGRPGVVIIAGTGSIAMGTNPDGESARAGGWGPTLGDEGSGFDIARKALKAVLASFDGRLPETALTDLICTALGIESPRDLPGVIYNSEAKKVEIASLAKLVGQAAAAGDEVARDLLAQAGRDLGEMAASVIQRLGLADQRFRVACVGSVFKSGELVLAPLREAVHRVAPAAEIGPPLYSPAVGAVKLAL